MHIAKKQFYAWERLILQWKIQLLTAIRNPWKMYGEVLCIFPHFYVHVTVICRQLTGSFTPQISTSQPVVMPRSSIAIGAMTWTYLDFRDQHSWQLT